LAGLGVDHIRFHKSNTADALTPFGYVMSLLSRQTAVLFPQMLFYLGRYYGNLAFVADEHAVLRIKRKQAIKIVHDKGKA
jgi:hypothetical protein